MDSFLYVLDLIRQVLTHPETRLGGFAIVGIMLALMYAAVWLGEYLARREIESQEDSLKAEIDGLKDELDDIEEKHAFNMKVKSDVYENNMVKLKKKVYGPIDATTEACRLYSACMRERNEADLAEKIKAYDTYIKKHPEVHEAFVRIVCNVRNSDFNNHTSQPLGNPNLVAWGREGRIINEADGLLKSCPPEYLQAILQDRRCVRVPSGTYKGQLMNPRTIDISTTEGGSPTPPQPPTPKPDVHPPS